MNESEVLDRKALEQQYVDSYRYSSGQRLFGCLATLIILAVIIAGGTFLTVSIINMFTK